MLILIQCPALGKRLFRLVVHLQLAARDDRGGCIEEEVIRLCRHRAGNRVRADHCLASERRNHDCFTVRAAEADQAFFARHIRIVTRNAVMIGVARRDDAHAGLLCLLDCQLHRKMTDQLTHAVVPVDDGGDRRLKHNLGLCIDMNHALFDALVVAHHALHAVRLDAVQIGGQQNVLDDVRLCFREAEFFKCVHAEPMEQLIRPLLVSHFAGSPFVCQDLRRQFQKLLRIVYFSMSGSSGQCEISPENSEKI